MQSFYPYQQNIGAYAPNMYQRPIQQPMQPTQMVQQPQAEQSAYPLRPNNIQYATEEEIRAYVLFPNSQIYALDRNKQLLYVKTSDDIGGSVFSTYKLEKVVSTDNSADKVSQPTISKETITELGIATKEDLKPIIDNITRLENQLRAKVATKQ